MNTLSAPPDKRSQSAETAAEIPAAFRRAFEPSYFERATLVVRAWLRQQAKMAWLPRSTDPVTELKHAWLGDYALVPPVFEPARSTILRARAVRP